MIVETLGDDGSHPLYVIVSEEGEIGDDWLGIVNESGKVIHVESPERVGIHRDIGLLLAVSWIVVMLRRRGVVGRSRFVRARICWLWRIGLRWIASSPRRRVLTVSRHRARSGKR